MHVSSSALAPFLDRNGRQELSSVLAPYYEDAGPLLSRELEHCSTIYAATDDAGVLQAFFLMGWKDVEVEGASVPTAYLGLSANRLETRETYSVRELYSLCRSDLIAWERAHGRNLTKWWTTASAAALVGGRRTFGPVAPDEHGLIPDGVVPVFRALRALYGLGDPLAGDHLAVLRSVATATRYSPPEAALLKSISARYGTTLLDELGVVEDAGDRLLCVSVPG